MGQTYLWANQSIIDEDENVIWGLLEDIRKLYAKPVPSSRGKPTMSRGSIMQTPVYQASEIMQDYEKEE